MASTLCINDHRMWNGGGTVCIEAYSENFVKDFSDKNPNVVLYDDETSYFAIFDVFEKTPEAEPDVWRCTDCKSLAIFLRDKNRKDVRRLDYVNRDDEDFPDEEVYRKWEKYYAMDEKIFEDFCEASENKNLTPYQALKKYEDDGEKMYYAYVDEKHDTVVVEDYLKKPFRLYRLVREIEL